MENIFKGVNAIFYSIHFHELMFPTGSSMSFSCATIFCPGCGSPGPNKTITSEDTACLLLENLYKWFRLQDKIISHSGPQFISTALKELLRVLGIKLAAFGTVYSLPSPNRWNNRTSKLGNRSIPVNLLCFSSGRMASRITHILSHSQ